MSKTKADFVAKALSNLGVLAAGQAVTAEDSDAMGALVTPVLEELSGEGVVTVPDQEAIDDNIFLPLARILAEKAAPEYGRESNEQVIMLAKVQIYKVTYGRPTGEVLEVDYF